MKIRHIILTIITLLSSATLAAQELKVQAPQKVYVGDEFTVQFVVDAHVGDFRGPTFKGFSTLSGPHTSQSTSMSFVNGKMSQSSSTTFTYKLRADVEGTFTIGAASCTVDGKKITSNTATVKVEKLSAAAQQQRKQQQQQQQAYDPWGSQPSQPTTIDEKSLFARATVSKQNPYQGEQVIVTYKIYTQIPISQYTIDKLPGNRGFWAEDLTAGGNVKQYDETIGDRHYKVAEIRRGALFAQESGKLSIEPLDLNVLAMVQRQRRRTGSIFDLFDDPFFNAREAVERPVSTNRISVNVRPLPAAPEGFSGAVGRFDAKGGTNIQQVKANEAISYRITVSGSGNLMLVDAPTPDFPPVFEVYEPQISDNINKTENGISGSRTWEWVLIPRSQGTYTIPATKFVYFDPSTGQYNTRTIEQQSIEVAKGDAQSAATLTAKDDVKLLGSDINYMHPTTHLHKAQPKTHPKPWFWALMGLTVIATAATLILGKRHDVQQQDVATTRKKRATRMARRRMKKAEAYLGNGDTERFYDETYRAIWGFLADKYNIALATLGHDTVSQCLEEKQVPAEQRQSIMHVLQDVDMARFAPGDAEAQKQRIYDEAIDMIANL